MEVNKLEKRFLNIVIQRIQTVWLFLAVVLNTLVFFTPLYTEVVSDPGDWLMPLLMASLGFSALGSVYGIFQYNKRPYQIKVVTYSMLFQIIGFGASVGVVLNVIDFNSIEFNQFYGPALILFAWILQFMAIKGIQKDEKLVKSMDRIR